jgi:hypothetical protein
VPQRTTPFQTLITEIVQQLAGSDATVIPSKLVCDRRTGQLREVDIVVEAPIAGHVVVIGVECIEHGRPATIEWIDKMKGKHRDTEIDKLVLVSKSGFAATAKASAESLGFQALSLAEAKDTDWTHTVHLQQQMTMRTRAFEIKESRMTLVNLPGVTLRDLTVEDCREVIFGGSVLNQDGSVLAKFTDLINWAFHSPSAIERFEHLTAKDEDRLLRLDLDFSAWTHFIDPDGHVRYLKTLWAIFKVKHIDDVVQFTHASYGDARVAYGQGSMQGRSVTVVVTEQQGYDAQLGFVVEGP